MSDSPIEPSAPDLSFIEMDGKYEAHRRLRASLIAPNKTAIFDALAASGISRVTVTFDGYGDSGQIEDIAAKAGETPASLPETTITVARAVWDEAEPQTAEAAIAAVIEDIAYQLLEQTHCGWENNAGAFGEFTFDVAARTITLEYNERFEGSEYYEHTF